jgi:hypothetical protein
VSKKAGEGARLFVFARQMAGVYFDMSLALLEEGGTTTRKETKKRLRSSIGWFGGKGMLVSRILRYVPEHRYYLEAFGSGASLLFANEHKRRIHQAIWLSGLSCRFCN